MDNNQDATPHKIVEYISKLLADGRATASKKELNKLHPAEIAHTLEALPHDDRALAWDLIDD